MIVNVMRRTGDSVVLERVDRDLFFEGGAAEEGVLATFQLDGREVTGRIVRVLDGAGGGEAIVDVELIDEADHDFGTEVTRANLPPPNDTKTKV
jgi:hypothetical protein